jgi:two-component system, NtrC family, sensor kinase
LKSAEQIYRHYQDLQTYVGWTDDDARRVSGLALLLESHLPALVEDFYAEIARHPEAHNVFTGGLAQIDRLKGSLLTWLRDLLTGPYDRDYVVRRWRVGARHVEIGLDQVYTNVALSRLRDGLVKFMGECWPGDRADLVAAIRSLNKLLDLDLAKIEDAYQAEYAARLQRTERLATLGQIAGGVAHELRNPLNVVKTSLYYLNNARPPTPEKRAEHMQRIERGVDRANDVITTLSNFARMPLPELRPFAVEPCVRDALDDSTLPAGIEVTLDFPADLAEALADPDQIRIALGNLIRNANDAMPSGGHLTLSGQRDGNGVKLVVADTGVGISPEDLGRIMEPLYSTKARGLGLGLALSRMILERNQGNIQVVSETGKGSTFTVHLMAAATDGVAGQVEQGETHRSGPGGL